MTNPYREDGFGGQFQTIIYSAIYAEMHNMPFKYTPFQEMEHNYDNDPSFLEKKEELINFIPHFEINKDLHKQIGALIYINFFEKNLDVCSKTPVLAKIKKIFRENKKKSDFFDLQKFNIAIHIRRPNIQDNRLSGSDIPDWIYLKVLKFLLGKYKEKNPIFHIYSQGDPDSFKAIYGDENIVFHIDESIEKTFSSFVFADVLVTSASSFSYTAGILSNGEVYYMPFWHPPLPDWISIDQKILE